MEERILIGLFLCSTESNEILEQLRPEWNKEIHLVLEKKLLIINYSLVITDTFPWNEELSEGINYEKFCRSFFTQPDLFFKIEAWLRRCGERKNIRRQNQLSGD